MGTAQLEVHQIVSNAVNGAANIPEFQRGFVWRADQVRDLVDSLYRDYPVGAMLVWDASAYEIARAADSGHKPQWIVDGQQRTTALCVAFGRKPYWWPDAASWNKLTAKIDVLANLRAPDGNVEFSLANPVRSRDPHWVSVRRILRISDEDELYALADTISSERGLQAGSSEVRTAERLIRRIWDIRARSVPVISVSHELEDVAEIFGRLNQAGTLVKEADVTVALVAAANPGWVRDEFLSYSDQLADAGFDLDAGVYIRTLTGIAHGTATLKDIKPSFWRDDIRHVWPGVKTAINATVNLLRDRGILSAELLPSRNSLIPLFALQSTFGDRMPFDHLYAWFLLANADGRYSGSSITALTQDLSTIKHAASGDDALATLRSRLRVTATVEPARFLDDYSRDRFGRLLIYLLLFNHGATDWVSKVRIGFDRQSTALNDGFQPEWHHIFPRAVLKALNRDEADANLLANITVLNEATNRNKLRAKPPTKYIAEFAIGAGELQRHLVPAGVPLTADHYDDFVTGRAELLASAANAYLEQLAATPA